MTILPLVGLKLPAMIFTSVDLPAPLSPMSPRISPLASSSDTPSSAWMAPKFLVISFSCKIGMRVFPDIRPGRRIPPHHAARNDYSLNDLYYRICPTIRLTPPGDGDSVQGRTAGRP